MSDHSIAIVPQVSSYHNRVAKAKEMLNWLVEDDIVKPTLTSCVLGFDGGYAISGGAKNVIGSANRHTFSLDVNGLEIITERHIFDTGGNGIEEIYCPACQQNLAEEDLGFLEKWYEGNLNDVACPVCDTTNSIHQFRFTPQWGFSDLGFKFWNWPDLTEDFVSRFQQKLGVNVSVIYQRI